MGWSTNWPWSSVILACTAVRLNSPNLELNAYACGKKNHANHNGTRKQHRLLHGNSQSLAVGSG